MRTPDELRLSQIAEFFGVTVEYLRRDNAAKPQESSMTEQPSHVYAGYDAAIYHSSPAPALREPDAPPYGLPSLRREENLMALSSISELSQISGRLLAMICSSTKGVIEGRFDAGKTIIVLRRLGDILEHKLREADCQTGSLPPPPPTF